MVDQERVSPHKGGILAYVSVIVLLPGRWLMSQRRDGSGKDRADDRDHGDQPPGSRREAPHDAHCRSCGAHVAGTSLLHLAHRPQTD